MKHIITLSIILLLASCSMHRDTAKVSDAVNTENTFHSEDNTASKASETVGGDIVGKEEEKAVETHKTTISDEYEDVTEEALYPDGTKKVTTRRRGARKIEASDSASYYRNLYDSLCVAVSRMYWESAGHKEDTILKTEERHKEKENRDNGAAFVLLGVLLSSAITTGVYRYVRGR